MGRPLNILIVDDEPAIRQVLVSTLKKAEYAVVSAKDGSEALRLLENGDVDVAICDINMPGIDGIEMVREAKSREIETIFLMMTAFASVDTAVKAIKAGAYDYMTKPLRKEDVLLRLEHVENLIGLRDQNRTLRNLVSEDEKKQCRLVSPGNMGVDKMIRKVAPTDSTVLITGESGTGKGVVARQIHMQSPRNRLLFIPVNCGSIPENLLESEFFGHTKGAFTGADKAKKGLFAEAHQGTLFLDEIGELPLHLQVKLLHALEEKKIRPVGSEQFRHVDVRIVAATNKNLEEMVAKGTFREDLFFRLNVFNIYITPLRSRPEDIPLLTRFFLQKNRAGKNRPGSEFSLEPEAEQALKLYAWPGNIRELENVIERALILAEDGQIRVDDLPGHIARLAGGGAENEDLPGSAGEKLRDRVRAFEAQVILETIEKNQGDRRQAAKILGIGLSSLYRKLEQADLPDIFHNDATPESGFGRQVQTE
ncbi:MAG: sigma-54 dependent transcriptional regulator [Magnetococcus sp. DMHC-1]